MRSKQFIIGILMMMLVMIPVLGGCGRQEVPETEAEAAVSTAESIAEDSSLIITALKGGAADSFVLLSENHVVVIDTGLESKADKLVEFLKSQGVTRVDELIITHYDKDHVGGADHIISEFEVGKVYTTYHSKESDDITEYIAALESKGLSESTVTELISFEADNVTYTIYPPQKTSYADSESNNSSLVVRVTAGENSMLFAGDAESERISELLETTGLESTVLKIPHHGRIDANTEKLIDYINPDYAIITSSGSEPEDQEVLDMLESRGVKTYLTRDGNVTIVMDSAGIAVTQ
ncbi:ComEC/Rec2 family competence protein [Butyrivibrio sp. FCS014]|uniref:ComEC/Rec2 family competence protein n=1 Tax=Butyrivibrio sp. FCS014 TaxID=1408304 RepID=UPI0009E014DF|nr:MBL fold metallo-hydrolase [Butyrivibrio sp. FCS014]